MDNKIESICIVIEVLFFTVIEINAIKMKNFWNVLKFFIKKFLHTFLRLEGLSCVIEIQFVGSDSFKISKI
jgi:hypothetical protein